MSDLSRLEDQRRDVPPTAPRRVGTAARNLYAVGIARGTFTDGRVRLAVLFADTKGGTPQHEWSPEWLVPNRGVADLLREAVRVERANRPGSQFLAEFAGLARDILVEHAPPDEVKVAEAVFERYWRSEDGTPKVKVEVGTSSGSRWWVYGPESWVLGVPLTTEVLRRLTSREILDWVLWDGKVIDVLRNGTSIL